MSSHVDNVNFVAFTDPVTVNHVVDHTVQIPSEDLNWTMVDGRPTAMIVAFLKNADLASNFPHSLTIAPEKIPGLSVDYTRSYCGDTQSRLYRMAPDQFHKLKKMRGDAHRYGVHPDVFNMLIDAKILLVQTTQHIVARNYPIMRKYYDAFSSSTR